jgi:hypothetical protein
MGNKVLLSTSILVSNANSSAQSCVIVLMHVEYGYKVEGQSAAHVPSWNIHHTSIVKIQGQLLGEGKITRIKG